MNQEEMEAWLQRWADGDPVHNHEDGACVPDFSCCIPELAAPKDERDAFMRLDLDARLDMLHTWIAKKTLFEGGEVQSMYKREDMN